MVTVRCEPTGAEVEVEEGCTLLDAVRRAGQPVAVACDGDGVCGKCGLVLVSGELPPAGDQERLACRANGVPPGQRLACQARVLSDVVVRATYW